MIDLLPDDLDPCSIFEGHVPDQTLRTVGESMFVATLVYPDGQSRQLHVREHIIEGMTRDGPNHYIAHAARLRDNETYATGAWIKLKEFRRHKCLEGMFSQDLLIECRRKSIKAFGEMEQAILQPQDDIVIPTNLDN